MRRWPWQRCLCDGAGAYLMEDQVLSESEREGERESFQGFFTC